MAMETKIIITRAENRGERGMTLLEVLLAGTLSAVLLMALSVSSGVAVEFYSNSADGQDLNLSHNLAMSRITKAVATASDVAVDSATSLLCTFPGGATERYTWSGEAGDSVLLSKDGADANELVDGVTGLSFSANMATGYEESVNISSGTIVSFESYENDPQEWIDCVLDGSNRHGVCFNHSTPAQVEKIVLTSLLVRIGRTEDQTGDLSIVLMEGFSEEDPRPWGAVLASHLVENFEIPDVAFPGGDMYIDWMTIDLPETFVVQPNRYYCLLFTSDSEDESAYLRVASILSGSGPENGMAYVGTDNGGSTWDPAPGSGDHGNKDLPIDLDGMVYTNVRTPVEYTESVDVDLSLDLGNRTACGSQSATVRGGGER